MPVARRWTVALTIMLLGVGSYAASAQEVEYKEIDGVRYQITRQVVKENVPVTVMQDRQQTYYAPQTTTENITHQQTYSVPVTQYQTVPVLVGRWNPFATPYWAYEVEQVTTWQNQVANVQIPVSRVTWAPQTKTVQVPVTEFRTAEREIITRVAMSSNASTNSNQALATAQPINTAQPLNTGQPLVSGQPVYNAQPTYTAQPLAASPQQQPYRSATLAARPGTTTNTPIGGHVMSSDPPRQATGEWQTPPANSRYR